MRRIAICSLFLLVSITVAQPGDILTGTIKKLDIERFTIVLTQGGKDRLFLLTDQTKVFGSDGKNLKERMAFLKEGTAVFFRPSTANGKEILVGIRPVDANQPNVPFVPFDASNLKPLTEMGAEKYQGFAGGLYPDGKNDRPAAHEKAGLALSLHVQPRDAEDKPDPNGKIVLLSIGMSNTSQASEGFAKQLAKQTDLNPRMVFVNGAQGGMTARAIKNPNDDATGSKYWKVVDQRLQTAGASRAQVQAIWIKEANAGPREGFPKYAQTLQAELAAIVQLLPERFPNARLVYLSGRTFGGYARTPLNPEPYAFESGLAVRWLIEQQLNGDRALAFDAGKGKPNAPWLSWGPYLWANGAIKRSDGFSYLESDFASDGTHHSLAGQMKVGQEMLRFFRSDTTTRPWFLRGK